MKKYQPTDLIKFASRTGRWTVKKINNMPTLTLAMDIRRHFWVPAASFMAKMSS